MNPVHLMNPLQQLESIHQILRLMKWSRKVLRKKRRKKGGRPQKQPQKKCRLFKWNSFGIGIGKMELSKQDQKYETMLRDIFEQQRKIDAEERQKDRDFFLELGKIFSGNM